MLGISDLHTVLPLTGSQKSFACVHPPPAATNRADQAGLPV